MYELKLPDGTVLQADTPGAIMAAAQKRFAEMGGPAGGAGSGSPSTVGGTWRDAPIAEPAPTGPWTKYQQQGGAGSPPPQEQAAQAPTGPWTKYQQAGDAERFEQLKRALKNADAAGDTAAAQKLADALRQHMAAQSASGRASASPQGAPDPMSLLPPGFSLDAPAPARSWRDAPIIAPAQQPDPAANTAAAQKLAEIREKYPQYNDMSDAELADRLYKRFYSDLPRAEFDARIGFSGPQPDPGAVKPWERDWAAAPAPQPDPGAKPGVPLSGMGPDGGNLNWNDPGYVAESRPAAPTAPSNRAGRALTIGAQGAGAGFAGLAGMPVDLAALAIDGGMSLAETIAGLVGDPVELPRSSGRAIGGSQSIREGAARVAEGAGVELVPEDQMSTGERLAYNVNRLGTEALGGATGLARGAAARFARPGTAPRVVDGLLRPYADDVTSAVARDTAAGVGAGAAVTAAETFVPESSGARPIAELLAVLAGGATGAELADAASRIPGAVARRATGGIERSVPLDAGNMPTTARIADKAATIAQEGRSRVENSAVARAIAEEADAYRSAGLPVPTSGVLSADPGLASLEGSVRTRNRSQFVEPDQRIQSAAAGKVDGMAAEDADTELPRRVAQQRYDDEAGAARGRREGAADALAGVGRLQGQVDQEAAALGAATAVPDPSSRMQRASEAFGENVLGQPGDAAAPAGGLRAMTTEKNRLYAAPEVDVDASPLAVAAKTVRDGVSRLQAANAQAPVGVLERLDKIMPRLVSETVHSGILDEAGRPITRTRETAAGGTGEVSWRELSSLHADLDAVKRSARSARMSPEYLASVDTLKAGIRGIGRSLVEGGSEAGQQIDAANRFFREVYAPVWGRDRPVNSVLRDKALWSEVPPDLAKVLDMYRLTAQPTPAVVEDLARVVQVAKSPEEAQNAVRRYVTADLGASVVDVDGRVNARKLRAWRDERSALLDNAQFADMKGEVDGLLRAVVNNDRSRGELGAQAEEFARRLKQAEGDEVATLRRLDNSALRLLIDNEPAQAARAVLNSGRGRPIERAREIRGLLKNDPEAMAGWQRAVSEELRRRVQTTRLTPDGDRELSLAGLIRQVDDLTPVLSEVFEPAQMHALTQARRLLEPYQRLGNRSTPGNFADKGVENLWSAVSLVNRAMFGVLKGGGVTRTFKDVFGRFARDDDEAVNALLVRMMTDPELAQHLLQRPIPEVGTPIWNKRLFQLIGVQEATTQGEADGGR